MKILVLDTETTDTKGASFGDLVVEIGIAEVDTDKKTVRPFFESVCGYDVMLWNALKRNAWVFKNTDLTLEMVRKAPPVETVAEDLRMILDGTPVTAFNIDFDFGRFLDHPPFNLKDYPKAPDIMMAADTIEEIHRSKYDPATGWRAWPNAEATYNYLFGEEDPANIGGKEKHRALSDAIVEGYILLELVERGIYKLPKVTL